ncbi:MAG: hypothetical protein P4L66_11205 [Acetobacteraceae bacterium]|nr:hypothetical protein [Acetobacteraceae bacterium]
MPIDAPAPTALRSLAALLQPFRFDPRAVPRLTFEDALVRDDFPYNALSCLRGLGHSIDSFDDLLSLGAIPENQNDIRCTPVSEGVAISVWFGLMWLLIER